MPMIKSIRWILVYIRPRENNHEEKWKIMKHSLFNKNRHDEIDSMHVTFLFAKSSPHNQTTINLKKLNSPSIYRVLF